MLAGRSGGEDERVYRSCAVTRWVLLLFPMAVYECGGGMSEGGSYLGACLLGRMVQGPHHASYRGPGNSGS